MIAPAIGKK